MSKPKQSAKANAQSEAALQARAFQLVLGGTMRLNNAFIEMGDLLGEDIGMNSLRWSVIGILRDLQPLRVPKIARLIGRTRQNVKQVLDTLEDQGLIEYERDPDHRRALHVVLTAKGEKTMDRLMERQNTLSAAVAERANLSTEALQHMASQIKQLNAAMEALLAATDDSSEQDKS